MALKQDKAKLKRLINQKDRTEFIQEFIKFKNTYFNGNFKQASIAIGESREKVGGIFDRAGVPQGGGGSLLTETIKTPKSVTKIQDLTTRLKYEPDFLKNQNTRIQNVVIDHFRSKVDGNTDEDWVYFLSHAHADHTVGLRDGWKGGTVFCSEITKRLIELQFQDVSEHLIALPMNESVLFGVDEDGKHVNVTLLDANHCPGAVMFLFEGAFGRVLHTGDFRYSPKMLASLKRGRKILGLNEDYIRTNDDALGEYLFNKK